MKNKFKLFAILGLTLSSVACSTLHLNGAHADASKTYYVDFFNNYLRETLTLSSGTTGKGNNLLYKTITVIENSLINKPEDPVRKNYEFLGWCKDSKDTTGDTSWNFETDKVTNNTRLFARWGIAAKEDITEPEYTPPSTVLEESASTDYVINSIMNFKIDEDVVKVSTAALMKLEANKDNVLPLMEYKVKTSKSITATYASNHITVTCNGNVRDIQVKDNSVKYVLDNGTYEGKAAKYESKALEEESYHVMLAGSSSIEFWTTSKEDLEPIVSYNHGIGGTTIEEWTTSLNQRLVYPYKPKMVVYYVGINNVINSKQTYGEIWTNLEKFFNETHEAMPDTKVQYILMNLIPGYTSYFDTINAVNTLVRTYQKKNNNSSWLTLINPGKDLLKENGEPNAAYFRTDGLHLSYYGYLIWGSEIKRSILEGLENY